MSNYFSYFPTINHSLKDDGTYVEVTNILKRFAFREDVESKIDIFYDYSIKDGERPDIIADRYYGDSKYAWVILLFNDIIDPFYEWPLFGEDFRNYLVAKYGNIETAHQTTKKYFRILYQGFTKIDRTRVPIKKVEIDITTYNSLGANDKSVQTAYEYEVELNDERRNIRILDEQYLLAVIDEAESILRSTS